MNINTFSIVAHSSEEDAWGVSVASKFPAVGAVVPWARAGVGAVATQSYARLSYGPVWSGFDGYRYVCQRSPARAAGGG